MEGVPATPVRRRNRTVNYSGKDKTEDATDIRESSFSFPAPASLDCKETTSPLVQGLAEDGEAESHRRVTKRRRTRHTTEAAEHFSNRTSADSRDKTEDTSLIKESMSPPLSRRAPPCQAASSPVPEGSAEKDEDAEIQRSGTKRRQRQPKRKPVRPKVIKDEVTKFPKPVTPKKSSEKRRNHIHNKRQHTDNSEGLHSLPEEPLENNIGLSSPADKPQPGDMTVYVRRFKSAKRSLATDLECGATDANRSLTQELEKYTRSPESAASPDKPSGRVGKRVTAARSSLKGRPKAFQKGDAQDEKKSKVAANKAINTNWDSLRREAKCNSSERENRFDFDTSDLVDWEALRTADVSEVAKAFKNRGMHKKLAERIQGFLNRLVNDHGSLDLEWLRKVPPGQAKDFLMSIFGIGLKSTECIRLLALQQKAFPVDTNVGRICVRLGWVPLQPLPESTQLHLLELYPMMVSIQKYLWPRLCNLDLPTLYELHYQMITFGKIFCTKKKPNCHACPMREECRHFASEFASAKLLLEWKPDEKNTTRSLVPVSTEPNTENGCSLMCLPMSEGPATPECREIIVGDIEDIGVTNGILIEQIWDGVKERNLDVHYDEISKAIISVPHNALPAPKLKNVTRLRTEHQAYELHDEHPLLERVDKRVHDDPSPYLLAIWTPGETAESTQSPKTSCNSKDVGKICDDNTCSNCNSRLEETAQVVKATLLIPCRTANRGGSPLNGTYFQINEVFADHASSCEPMLVPRKLLWNLPRRTVYFGRSIPSIFRGMSAQDIQTCCLKGYVCVRGFDRENGRPMRLKERLHKRPKSKKVQKASAEGSKSKKVQKPSAERPKSKKVQKPTAEKKR